MVHLKLAKNFTESNFGAIDIFFLKFVSRHRQDQTVHYLIMLFNVLMPCMHVRFNRGKVQNEKQNSDSVSRP